MYKQRVISNVSDFRTEECFKIHRLILVSLKKENPMKELNTLYGINTKSLSRVKTELMLYLNKDIMNKLKQLFKVKYI